MNFVKRGLRSLLYHWKNTAALVVIYFLSSALVLVGLNIRQACLATTEEAGEKIGADIAVTNTYQANSFTAEERNNLPLTLADQLAALPGVSSASWTATLSGASNNFSSAAMTREDGRAPLLFFASQTSSLLDLFTSQGASLALGRPLEREDRGLALVALPLAEENGWELDSVFSVTAASGQEISLQVAGIYLPGEGTGPEGGLGIPWDNTIVLCLEDAMELLGGEQVSQIRLELEDPKDARSLAAAVEETAGASPETLVKLEKGVLHTFPLAGTRPRGKTEEEDLALERELLADPKELAEHSMLVDLGRNDLGRVSRFGSVEVERLYCIERFSHVMHIGSTVRGELAAGKTALDAIDAVLPAGTLSGAPKIRACQLISELEKNRRGIYGGAIGYLGFNGSMDTCIAIRIAYKKNGKVFVRSGAGIVADSDPEKEYQECINKAAAVLRALELAEEAEPCLY